MAATTRSPGASCRRRAARRRRSAGAGAGASHGEADDGRVGADASRRARRAPPGAAPTRRWCAGRRARRGPRRRAADRRARRRCSGCGRRRPMSASSTSGRCSRSSTTMRARNPWVWCACGAPARSETNASSGSASAGSGSRSSTVTAWPARPSTTAGREPADPSADHDDLGHRRHPRAAGRGRPRPPAASRAWAVCSPLTSGTTTRETPLRRRSRCTSTLHSHATLSTRGRARDITRTCFAEAGYLGDQRRAEIVASELVTNSILHGDDPITLHLWPREDRLRIGVSDGQPRSATGAQARLGVRPVRARPQRGGATRGPGWGSDPALPRQDHVGRSRVVIDVVTSFVSSSTGPARRRS